MKMYAKKKSAALIISALTMVSVMAVGYASVTVSKIRITGDLSYNTAGHGSPVVDINWTAAAQEAVYAVPDLTDVSLGQDGSVVAKDHTITVATPTFSGTSATVSITGFSTVGDFAIVKFTVSTGASNNMQVIVNNVETTNNASTYITVSYYEDAACTVNYFDSPHIFGANESDDIYVKFLCTTTAESNSTNDFTLAISSVSGEWL